jgi:hypothetical protein
MQKNALSSLVLGSLLSTLLLTSCSHKLAPSGNYQTTPVVADGVPDEWKLPLRFSNESYTLQYTVTNDNKNIYICILSRDEATQLRMLRNGMSVCFDPKGEKNKNISIAFPIRKQPEPDAYRNRSGNPITAADMKSRKEQLLLQSDYYNTIGFQHIENGQYALKDNKSDIQVAMKLNNEDSLLVYEAIVPIKDVLGADLSPKSESRNFSVGIVLNAAPGQGGGNGNYSRPSYGGMRGGMMGMRGMGGGRGNYGSSQRSAGAKEETDWYQFQLASGKNN